MIGSMALFWTLVVASLSSIANAATTHPELNGMTVAGYQGWYTILNQTAGTNNYKWFIPNDVTPGPPEFPSSQVLTDVLPYTADYPEECLLDTNFILADGTHAKFYNSYCTSVIEKHFQYMVTNKLDGLFVQRFYSTTEENTPGSGYNATLGVLLTVKEMAEKYGKYFAVEYDMSGLPPDFDPNRYIPALTDDYNNVLKPLFESPNYIYQDGRPVLQIWGVGTNATAFPGNKFHDLINRYHSTPENPWIILGVPQTWMEFANTTNDPTGFYEAYQAAEALQPWPVGAWNDVDSLRGALNQYILPCKAQLDAWGVKYMGAYHPGTGNRNAARRPGEPIGPLDNRFNGTFFEESIKLFTNDTIKPFANFIAMFDEYTEGSQLLPYIQFKNLPPNPNPGFLGSDDDKSEFFYMQLAGNGTAALHELWGQPLLSP